MRRSVLPAAVAVFATFLVYSAVAQPVPGINEPHYLCKARHYWNPDWCAGDLFLESGDEGHFVFYVTVGQLTRLFSLEASAWIGRVIALGLLAFGWTALVSRLISARWAPVWTAWAFLGLSSIGNFSGEWLIGGVEAKVLSYAFVFAGLAFLLDRRWNRAALCAGLAISFHVVVGMWALLAVIFAGAVTQLRTRRTPVPVLNTPRSVPLSRRAGLPLLLLIIGALPGLVPALQLVFAPVPERVARIATYIQVFYRLRHHLDPMDFPLFSYAWYVGLLVAWCALMAFNRKSLASGHGSGSSPEDAEGRRRAVIFSALVAGSLLIAFAGLLIGWGPRPAERMPWYVVRMSLLKFYPFRLFDLLLPMAVAIELARLAARFDGRAARTWIVTAVFPGAFLYALLTEHRHPSGMPPALRADWLSACRWIDAELPADALVMTPGRSWAFKWYAERPEFVTFKDAPQDPAGLVEWNRRLRFLRDWGRRSYADGSFSAEELSELRELEGITHLLVDRLGPIQAEPIYRNRSYRVYDLQALDEAAPQGSRIRKESGPTAD